MLTDEFITSIRRAWSAATAADDNTWSSANPATGHCDVTSLVVREHAGGNLRMAQVFRNGELSEHHYWNVLPDGTELDLTFEQFDGSETLGTVTDMDEAFFAAAGPMNDGLVSRLDRFREQVATVIELGFEPT